MNPCAPGRHHLSQPRARGKAGAGGEEKGWGRAKAWEKAEEGEADGVKSVLVLEGGSNAAVLLFSCLLVNHFMFSGILRSIFLCMIYGKPGRTIKKLVKVLLLIYT